MCARHELQSRTLQEYHIKLPISMSTTWRWMQAVNIYRDKYRQNYYNDKHQDATVIEDRKKYIQVMDELSLRLPLWLQLPMHEFWSLKDRLPHDPLLVHHYDIDGAHMVEVHVDLDDSFDARRALLPLGGQFSVRFPGRPPTDTALRRPPLNLPSPGAGLTPLLLAATREDEQANPSGIGAATDPTPPPRTLPTVAEMNKMKVLDLKAQLASFGLCTDGLRAVLLARLRDAVAEAQAASSAAAQNDGDDSESDQEEWAVRKILSRRVVTHVINDISFDSVEYQVEWDFPDANAPNQFEITWEGESNLTNAVESLHEFLESQPKEPNCKFGHVQGVCRCSLPLIHAGQDESIFKAFQKSSFQYVVNGVRGLRKKTDGPARWCLLSKMSCGGLAIPYRRRSCP